MFGCSCSNHATYHISISQSISLCRQHAALVCLPQVKTRHLCFYICYRFSKGPTFQSISLPNLLLPSPNVLLQYTWTNQKTGLAVKTNMLGHEESQQKKLYVVWVEPLLSQVKTRKYPEHCQNRTLLTRACNRQDSSTHDLHGSS